MTKTITTEEAVILFNFLSKANRTNLKGKAVFPVIRAIAQLRPIHEAYAKTEELTQTQLRPDDWDKLVEEESHWDSLPDAVKAAHNATVSKYQSDVAECLSAERKKAITVDIEPLSEDDLIALLDSNPEWPIGAAEAVVGLFEAPAAEPSTETETSTETASEATPSPEV